MNWDERGCKRPSILHRHLFEEIDKKYEEPESEQQVDGIRSAFENCWGHQGGGGGARTAKDEALITSNCSGNKY
jgi:hypothetical protein